MSKPLIGVYAVTYGHSIHQLRVFLSSLMVQTSQNFKVLLMHDGPEGKELAESVLKEYSDMAPGQYEFYHSRERGNCFGHNLRDLAIKFCDTKFLLITNSDNYYMPMLIEIIENQVREFDPDFIMWNMCHNYGGACFGKPPYSAMDVQPYPSHIDIGSFCVRTKLAKKTGFNHRDMAADAWFVGDLRKDHPNMKLAKTSSVLLVHN